MTEQRIEELCRSQIDGLRQLWVERLVRTAVNEALEEAVSAAWQSLLRDAIGAVVRHNATNAINALKLP